MSSPGEPVKIVEFPHIIPGGAGGEANQPGQPGAIHEVTLPNGDKILCITGHGGPGGAGAGGGRGGEGGSFIFHK
jgi:hypothetical protein